MKITFSEDQREAQDFKLHYDATWYLYLQFISFDSVI